MYQAWGYGRHLHLRFEISGKTYWAHYCHCQDIYVSAGQAVSEGQLIGRMGTTGNSTHCHLHFEIKNQPTGVDGVAATQADLAKWEDPIPFIEKNMIPIVNWDMKVDQMKNALNSGGTSESKAKEADKIFHS